MNNVSINVPALEKLLDYTASGVGAVAGPMLANWRAQREGMAKLTSAQYDAEVRRIEAESRAQSLLIIEEAQSKARHSIEESTELSRGKLELSDGDITQSLEFQNRKRLANVKSVVEDAAEQLGDEEVPDQEPDHDWTARFFDFAQDVTSEDMRRIWANILAGEVKQPGQTSMRTLETLRNMKRVEANVFREFCDFVINYEFVFHDFHTPEFQPLIFGRLLHLQECGLISTTSDLLRKVRLGESRQIFFHYNEGLLLLRNITDGESDLEFLAIHLTSAGRELSMLAAPTIRMDYLQVFAKHLQDKGCELDFLEGVGQLPNGNVSYEKRTRIQRYAGV